MRKLLFILAASFAVKSNAQQLIRASGDVQIVTTAGTKTVIDGGGITFMNTSKWTATDDSIYLYKSTATPAEGWLDSTTAGAMDPTSTGGVFLRGTNRQSFYGPTRFYNLFIRNTAGDTLLSSCEVRNNLHLDTGFVFTRTGYGNDSLWVSNTLANAISSTSSYSKSWVNGRLSRSANQTTPANEYYFHIGKIKLSDSLYAPIKLEKFNTNINRYTAEYFPTTPYDNLNTNLPIDHISGVEYWEITATLPTGPDAEAKMSLSWRTYSQVSSNAAQRLNLLVTQYVANPGFAWWKLGSAVPHTVTDLPDQTFGYVKHPDYMGAFSFADRRYAMATSTSNNPLPVKLIYFTAFADGNKVRLNWDTRNDYDITGYVIEKSLNGSSFAYMAATSSMQRAQWLYTNYDYAPVEGWNFYRLKITDKDGRITYSDIRKVKFSKGMEEISIFPNPATDLLNIQMPSSYSNTVTLQVFGVDGKYISSLKPAVNTVQMQVAGLPAGTYILVVLKNDGSRESYRFVKQ